MKIKYLVPVIFLMLSCSDASAQIQVGDTAPDFHVTDVHGYPHHLYSYTGGGQYVLLDFFFTTCAPCQYYTPQISLAYEAFGCNDGGVVILGIDYNDTDEEVLEYEQTYGALYPSASGLEGGGNAVVIAYDIWSYPFVCLIDTSNIVVEVIDSPTFQVLSYYFGQYGIEEMECLTASGEIPVGDLVSMFPNPASSLLKIEAPAGMQVTIFSLDGREVMSFFMELPEKVLDVSALDNGIYTVRFHDDNSLFSRKLVLTH